MTMIMRASEISIRVLLRRILGQFCAGAAHHRIRREYDTRWARAAASPAASLDDRTVGIGAEIDPGTTQVSTETGFAPGNKMLQARHRLWSWSLLGLVSGQLVFLKRATDRAASVTNSDAQNG